MKLTIDHIRYARYSDLAALTGIEASYFSAWTKSRRLSERSLTLVAERLGMDEHDVLKGLTLRRRDAAIARKFQERVRQLVEAKKAHS